MKRRFIGTEETVAQYLDTGLYNSSPDLSTFAAAFDRKTPCVNPHFRAYYKNMASQKGTHFFDCPGSSFWQTPESSNIKVLLEIGLTENRGFRVFGEFSMKRLFRR